MQSVELLVTDSRSQKRVLLSRKWPSYFLKMKYASRWSLRGCDVVSCCGRIRTFRRNLLPPSLGWSDFRASRTWKTSTWIFTAMKASNLAWNTFDVLMLHALYSSATIFRKWSCPLFCCEAHGSGGCNHTILRELQTAGVSCLNHCYLTWQRCKGTVSKQLPELRSIFPWIDFAKCLQNSFV
jgi:hypothetical protein